MPVDVLLLQLGTPAAPTARALRPYLREFLTDPRVIEMSPWARWLLVNCIIVPFRSPKSAAKYKRIWDPQVGSPLLDITRRQTQALQQQLGPDFRVNFVMRYGEPSVPSMVRQIMKQKCSRLIVVPMFPQYSATTTASGFDAIVDALRQERVVPALRFIRDYHDEPVYLDAVQDRLQRSLAEAKQEGVVPEVVLVSFHGIPIDYIKRGDPYMRQSAVTGKTLAKRMGWKKADWRLVFQSRLGRQKWLTPYTDETLIQLGKQGVKTVAVVQPGFTADCLETIDEIGREGLEEFRSGGGETLVRVPCVNDDPSFIAALATLVRREAVSWI